MGATYSPPHMGELITDLHPLSSHGEGTCQHSDNRASCLGQKIRLKGPTVRCQPVCFSGTNLFLQLQGSHSVNHALPASKEMCGKDAESKAVSRVEFQ